jgi:hypothetical protein
VASIRAAAAITSITINGGTSLRADGVIKRRAVWSLIAGFPLLRIGRKKPCPAVAAFGRSLPPFAET